MWFGPAPIAQFFRRDSGIRLRPTKKLGIEAGPNPMLALDGIRAHAENAVWPLACHIRGARGSNRPAAASSELCMGLGLAHRSSK